MSNAKALSVGWRARPFSGTALDTLTPCRIRANGAFDFQDTLPGEKEAAVIDAWLRHSSQAAS